MNFKKKNILIIMLVIIIILLVGCKSKGTDKIYNDNSEISKEYDSFGIDRRDEGKFQKIEFGSERNIKENERLRNSIVETIKTSKNIDLKEVTNFKWDTMYVFTPYSNPKDILKEDIDFSGKYSDSMYMIAFIDNNQVSEFIELPNSFIKVDINEPIKVSRDEAKFNIYNKVMIVKTQN